jgi:peptide deformylase
MSKYYLIIGVLMASISYASKPENFAPQPYVVYDMKEQRPSVYSKVAEELRFPLSHEDMADVQTLEQQFDHEENCAGLAAPQIGISKQIIIFAAPENPDLRKFRPDFTQTMPKTIWINPEYTGIEESGISEDYEACFSVPAVAGEVPRYNKIKYRA